MADLDQIWSDYGQALRGFLRARVSDPDDVEDLLQEIMIRTHRNLAGLREDTKLRAWIYQIARNVVIDHYRKAGKGADLQADDLWYHDPDPATARDDLAACIAPMVRALPPEYAEVLTAVDLEGQAQKDYAAARGMPYSTLKSQVQSARKQLRGLFENCCRFSFDTRGGVSDYERKSDGCAKC